MASIFGKSSENLRKALRKMEASDWLLKIIGRNLDDIRSKNSSKRLISLTSWDHIDPIFRSHDGSSESVGKGSGIFGNLGQDKREKKRGGVGGGRKEKKRGGVGGAGKKSAGWDGWVMTSSKK